MIKTEIVATERDGCWFCERCWLAQHWKQKAYIIGKKKVCKKCLTESEKRGIINTSKGKR